MTIPRSDRTRSHHWSAGEGRNSPGRFPCNAHSKRTTQEKCYENAAHSLSFMPNCFRSHPTLQAAACACGPSASTDDEAKEKAMMHFHAIYRSICSEYGQKPLLEGAKWGLAPSAGMRSLSASRISSRSRTSSTSRAIMKNRLVPVGPRLSGTRQGVSALLAQVETLRIMCGAERPFHAGGSATGAFHTNASSLGSGGVLGAALKLEDGPCKPRSNA